MNQTKNYQLNQWEPEDRVTRADFNADNARLDAALGDLQTAVAGAAQVVFGKYSGNGVSNRVIELGFTPKAVLISRNDGVMNSSGTLFGGLFGTGGPLSNAASVVTGGFKLTGSYINASGGTFYYLALQ